MEALRQIPVKPVQHSLLSASTSRLGVLFVLWEFNQDVAGGRGLLPGSKGLVLFTAH